MHIFFPIEIHIKHLSMIDHMMSRVQLMKPMIGKMYFFADLAFFSLHKQVVLGFWMTKLTKGLRCTKIEV